MKKLFILLSFLYACISAQSKIVGQFEYPEAAERVTIGYDSHRCYFSLCKEDIDTTKEYLRLRFNKRYVEHGYGKDSAKINGYRIECNIINHLRYMRKVRWSYSLYSFDTPDYYRYYLEGEGVTYSSRYNANDSVTNFYHQDKQSLSVEVVQSFFEYLQSVNDGSIGYEEETRFVTR